MTEELFIPVDEVEAYVADPVDYLKRHIGKQQRYIAELEQEIEKANVTYMKDVTAVTEEKLAFRLFAHDAWKEIKAIGRNDVFCYERFELMARDLGLEPA